MKLSDDQRETVEHALRQLDQVESAHAFHDQWVRHRASGKGAEKRRQAARDQARGELITLVDTVALAFRRQGRPSKPLEGVRGAIPDRIETGEELQRTVEKVSAQFRRIIA